MTWIHAILQSIAAMMISPVVPSGTNDLWVGSNAWNLEEGNRLVYTAESEKIVEMCRANPEKTIVTPILAQGGHQLFLDGNLILSTADRTFQLTSKFHNTAVLPCQQVIAGKKLRWEAFTQTHSLAKLNHFPRIQEGGFLRLFLVETANIMIPGTLVGLGILCLLIFYGKVESNLLSSMLLVCLSFSGTCVLYVPQAFHILGRQTIVQSISDITTWLGFIFSGRLYHLLGYTNKRLYQILTTFCGVGIALILLSGNLDQQQIGSNIAAIGVYVFLLGTLFNRKLLGIQGKHRGKNELLKSVAALIFILSSLNDVLLFQVPMDSLPLGPFGIFCCTALLALAVNDRVVEAYEERDYLRANLEKEVERKTEDLRTKSEELEKALSTLKVAQADLVQSAKLAALGTLSAGIAHEINNALNYVNGSIEPMSNILKKDPLTEMDRSKAAKLLKLMKEGLDFTFGIIVNLKRHTSVMADKNEVLVLNEVVAGVLLLLKSKLSGVQVITELPSDVKIQASRVSLSQILINLIGNATDAIEEAAATNSSQRKEIKLTAVNTAQGVEMRIQDSGPGISAKNQERIFDPFFTTKAVGKGTGLGLHIVLSEVKKQGGRVEIQSPPGEGATFILYFPLVAEGMAA